MSKTHESYNQLNKNILLITQYIYIQHDIYEDLTTTVYKFSACGLWSCCEWTYSHVHHWEFPDYEPVVEVLSGTLVELCYLTAGVCIWSSRCFSSHDARPLPNIRVIVVSTIESSFSPEGVGSSCPAPASSTRLEPRMQERHEGKNTCVW